MIFTIVASVVLAALIYKLFLSKPYKNYWKKYGVPQIDTSSFATTFDILLGRKSNFQVDDYVYSKLSPSDKFCGIVEQGMPMIFLKDLDLIKKILIKDFDSFIDRRPFFGEQDGSLKRVLPSMMGDEWKGARSSISPIFTSGKIRRMMDSFNAVGKEWVQELKRQMNSNSSGSLRIDPVSTANLYSLDVIAYTVFGMKAGTVNNADSEFNKMANVFFKVGPIETIKIAFRFQFPKLCEMLKVTVFDPKAVQFFEGLFSHGLKQRLSGDIKRNDFLQLLAEAKSGDVKAVGTDELSTFEKEAIVNLDTSTATGKRKAQITDEDMLGHSMSFFFAGFSATSSFITFVMYALALYPEVQEKLREEIKKIVKPDGSFDYDDLGHLVYLDMVVNETLRKFGARLERKCVKDYKDPETGLVVPKGTLVIVPTNAIHHDRRYYDNPDTFDPENFSPEKKAARNPYAYMPFGLGPRNCIGMRFALVNGKAAISHVVLNFRIEKTENTPSPLRSQAGPFMVMPPNGLELKLVPLEKN